MTTNTVTTILLAVALFVIVMMMKTAVTFWQQKRILDAVHRYNMNLIGEGRWNESEVHFCDMENFDDTLWRLWDWGYKRILPAEKMAIIMPYLKGGEKL